MAHELKRERRNPLGNNMEAETLALIGQSQPEVKEVVVTEYVDNPNAIQRHEDGTMTYKRFTMTAVGLAIPENIGVDEWNDVGQVIRDLDSSISWVIGDWALYAKQHWNATASEIAEAFGYETSTIETYASICENIPRLIRNQTANFSHHRLIAKLTDRDLQAAWLYYMGHFKLRIADAKAEMSLLVPLAVEEALDRLVRAVESNVQLSDSDEFKKRLPKKIARKDDRYELRNDWLDYIRVEEPKRATMSPDQRQRLADRYKWLGKHFLEEADSLLGGE